ncbi:MAG: hypothetical protein WCS94_07395, partial [Verrucomicrobiota bacterium]
AELVSKLAEQFPEKKLVLFRRTMVTKFIVTAQLIHHAVSNEAQYRGHLAREILIFTGHFA